MLLMVNKYRLKSDILITIVEESKKKYCHRQTHCREVIKKGRQPIIKQNYQIKLQYFITDIQADKTLFIDLMLVNSKPYFISVLKPLKCVAVSKLIKRELYRLYLQQSYHILISLENTIVEFLYVELTVR